MPNFVAIDWRGRKHKCATRKSAKRQAGARGSVRPVNGASAQIPPKRVQETAARALQMRREYGRGGLSTQQAGAQGIGSGVARAATLAAGKGVSQKTAKRMVAYFARHAVDKKAQGFRSGESGYPSAGRVAWDLWGGDPGRVWAEKVVRQYQRAKGR